MNCLNNIKHTQIPNDVIVDYLDIYSSIGMNIHNFEVLSADYSVMNRQTISLDTYFFAKIFDLNVKETRLKSLIYKEVLPKNREEQLILNLKNAFIKIHKETNTFELFTNEIFDLLLFLYNDVIHDSKLQFAKNEKTKRDVNLLSAKYSSKREELELLIKEFNSVLDSKQYEVSYVILNFYIDFINIKPFVDKNDEIGFLLLYILLLVNGYQSYFFVSFMELINLNKDQFKTALLNSSFNWSEGFAQLLPLHRFINKISLQSYQRINEIIRDYEFDSQLNKSNNIENSINKLDDIFTKDEIRLLHPYISDSTINRTLKRMRDDDLIRPLGKGRSAKWMKMYQTEDKNKIFEQINFKI